MCIPTVDTVGGWSVLWWIALRQVYQITPQIQVNLVSLKCPPILSFSSGVDMILTTSKRVVLTLPCDCSRILCFHCKCFISFVPQSFYSFVLSFGFVRKINIRFFVWADLLLCELIEMYFEIRRMCVWKKLK